MREIYAMGTMLTLGFLAWPMTAFAAACAPCETTVFFCRECNTTKTGTEKCVNKQPRCTGCDTVSDTRCTDGGGSLPPEEQHQTLLFDPDLGGWRFSAATVVAANPVPVEVCGRVPAFSIY